MNVVDSSAWLSYFADDANAGVFSAPIENIDELIVPSIMIAEVFKCILRQRGEDMALLAIAHMEQGKVTGSIAPWRSMRPSTASAASCHWLTASFTQLHESLVL